MSLGRAILEGTLPRRSSLGLVLRTTTNGDDPPGEQVWIRKVSSSSPGGRAGLCEGDRLVGCQGHAISSAAELTRGLRGASPGSELELEVTRSGRTLHVVVPIEPAPLLTIPGALLRYAEFATDGLRLRYILTTPEREPHAPVALILQGVTCDTVDPLAESDNLYHQVARALAAHGVATLRLERRGTGDSEGPDTRLLDLRTELGDYVAFARHASEAALWKQETCAIVGFSMGGVLAPMVESAAGARSVVTFGTIGRRWLDHVLDTTRRQLMLAGLEGAELDFQCERRALVAKLMFVRQMSPASIREAQPELAHLVEDYPYSRDVSYFRQLCELPIPSHWRAVKARTLVVDGSGDFVVSREDARAVYAASARSRTELLEACIDHGLRCVSSEQDSFRGSIAAPFCHSTVARVAKWIRANAGCV